MATIKAAYKKAFVQQQDLADCGVACLATLIKFYGGVVMMERLRELSGTDKHGTTLLGVLQGAEQMGFDGDGYETDIEHLKTIQVPVILNVKMDEVYHHYFICYGYEDGQFIISDPGVEVTTYTPEALEKVWESKVLLLLKPNDQFQKSQQVWWNKWFWLKHLIQEDMNLLIMTLILGVLTTILGMSMAVFSQKLIDNILPSGNTQKLVLGLSLLFFILIINTILGMIRSYLLLQQSRDFNNRIINFFYSRLLFLPKYFFDNRQTGDMMARLNDTSRIQGIMVYLVTELILEILMVIVTSVFILIYSPLLGAIAIGSIPVYFLLAYLYHNPVLKLQRETMVAYAANESNYVDTIQGIGVIKSDNKENQFIHLTKSVYGYMQDKIFEMGKLGINIGIISGIFGIIFSITITSIGAYMVLKEEMMLGQLMAVMQVIGMLMPAAGSLASLNLRLQEARVAFDRMYEFTSIQPEYSLKEELQKEQVAEFKSLELQQIEFGFPGRDSLIEEMSIKVERGQMICLLGESGSGKSTTMQIIQKFYQIDDGNILVNGIPIQEVSTQAWRKMIAVVPQDIKLFNGNLMQNILMGEEANESELIKFCVDNGFNQFFDNFPQSYLTELGEKGVNISGGQQQLVALARALWKKPQLLLLDEATAAMDRNTEKFILQQLNTLKKEQNMGIILVTHRIKTARMADHVYVLEKGRIIAEGNHEALMKTENLYSDEWKELLSGQV